LYEWSQTFRYSLNFGVELAKIGVPSESELTRYSQNTTETAELCRATEVSNPAPDRQLAEVASFQPHKTNLSSRLRRHDNLDQRVPNLCWKTKFNRSCRLDCIEINNIIVQVKILIVAAKALILPANLVRLGYLLVKSVYFAATMSFFYWRDYYKPFSIGTYKIFGESQNWGHSRLISTNSTII